MEITTDQIRQMRGHLEAAVARSISHTEVTHPEIEASQARQAVDFLRAIAGRDGLDFDDVRNGETIEAWAYDASTPEGEMAWRVHLDAHQDARS